MEVAMADSKYRMGKKVNTAGTGCRWCQKCRAVGTGDVLPERNCVDSAHEPYSDVGLCRVLTNEKLAENQLKMKAAAYIHYKNDLRSYA